MSKKAFDEFLRKKINQNKLFEGLEMPPLGVIPNLMEKML